MPYPLRQPFSNVFALGSKVQRSEEEFLDGSLGCNNPIKQVLLETGAIFGSDQYVACIISIGSGQAEVIGLTSPDAFQKALPLDLIPVLRRIATDCESAAEDIEKRFQHISNVYFRFNVDPEKPFDVRRWDLATKVTAGVGVLATVYYVSQ